jgi:regulator of ribonuclease activity B
MSIILPEVDTERFQQQWLGDLDVLETLADHGDRPEIPRAIDISFVGNEGALNRLADISSKFGFTIQDRTTTEDGQEWLFLERTQTADLEAIRALRCLAIQLEDCFSVECDGWGCTAQVGSTH